eukprot:259752-Pyramimonas_sp.AAC.1
MIGEGPRTVPTLLQPPLITLEIRDMRTQPFVLFCGSRRNFLLPRRLVRHENIPALPASD